MFAKAVLIFCAQGLLIQSVFSQCTSRAAIDASGLGAPFGLVGPGLASGTAGLGFGYNSLAGPLAYDGLASSLPYDGLGFAGRGPAYDGLYAPAMQFTATGGGSLPVTSVSAIAPTGISVVSDNAFEGILSITGELPFVGTTGMEGALPTAGSGAINHACGDGITAMVSEASIAPGAAIAPIAASFGPAPAAASFGPATGAGAFGLAPFAGRFGPGGCTRNIIY